MLYLTCTTITSVDLAHYGVSRAEDWVSVDYGTRYICFPNAFEHICSIISIARHIYISPSTPVISNYRYLKVNILGQENLL